MKAAEDEARSTQRHHQQVVGDCASTTTTKGATAVHAGSQDQQQQQLVGVDAKTNLHAQQQQTYGKGPGAARDEGAEKDAEGNGDGDEACGEDTHLGARAPDLRPWSRREDEAITCMVGVFVYMDLVLSRPSTVNLPSVLPRATCLGQVRSDHHHVCFSPYPRRLVGSN